MNGTRASLGPLELVDGRWVLGDVGRSGGGAWVEFRAEGLYAHARDGGEHAIPWPRIMLGMGLALGGRHPKSGNLTLLGMLGGLPGAFRGRGGGYLHMTLRHPYENDAVFFDRHPRWYPQTHLTLLEELLRQAVRAGEAHRLADGDWLGRVVGRLAPLKPWTAGAYRKAVEDARQAEKRTGA
ncbi:hypothetical protein [Streptomyces chryseus]